MQPTNPHPQIQALRAAWEETVQSTIAIGQTLSEAQWLLPSPCPGWRLKDLISHLTGIENLLLDPAETITLLVAEKPWVKNEFGQFAEVAVDLRRGNTGAEILAEFEEVVAERGSAWRSEVRAPEEETFFAPVGMLPLGTLLWRRVFDSWAHNQDLRMPLGLSGDLDGKAAEAVYRQVARLIPAIFAKKCAAPIGSSAWLTITGPGAFSYGAVINGDGKGEFLKTIPENVSASIEMSTHDWYLLTCGRDGRENAKVELAGDLNLAAKVLENLTITP
ncbi:MAG TPA: maleylpyruvate isomerase family mycothiol-dependent enzyme [Candidatus Nanopelagicaceae bacterium]|nr:maleylpyruvate isomerase family mycothiol-dependent enzyme [Candidatus Nanopelagicaceae bacterium]